jgi:hypothetical protein
MNKAGNEWFAAYDWLCKRRRAAQSLWVASARATFRVLNFTSTKYDRMNTPSFVDIFERLLLMAKVDDHPALPVLSIWKERLGWGAYQKLRKTYPRDHDLSFANARKAVNSDICY